MSSNFFNVSNKLKSLSVSIGTVELVKEVIVSLELSYSNNSPVVECTLILDDLYEMNAQEDLKKSEVLIKYKDIFDAELEKKFVVLNVDEIHSTPNTKNLKIELQDKFSYTLSKSYLSKSFTSNPVLALEEYLVQLGINDYHELDFTKNTDSFGFTIPFHQDNLTSFMDEFDKYGYYFYQTKNKIVIKTISELQPSLLEENGVFIQQTDNQLYMNIIYDIYVKHGSKSNTPPKTRAVAYDISAKKVQYKELNNMDEYVLNDDTTNMQELTGTRDYYQRVLNFDQTKHLMREDFFAQNQCIIAVSGYIKNDLHQIYELKLAGNKSTSKSITDGNAILSGKWVSTSVVDKIVGDSLVQKITLNRVDAVKKK
jgi:hypothetical protein